MLTIVSHWWVLWWKYGHYEGNVQGGGVRIVWHSYAGTTPGVIGCTRTTPAVSNRRWWFDHQPEIRSLPGHVSIPLWAPILALAIAIVYIRQRPWAFPLGHCKTCGYDLTGNVTGVCSECGYELDGSREDS